MIFWKKRKKRSRVYISSLAKPKYHSADKTIRCWWTGIKALIDQLMISFIGWDCPQRILGPPKWTKTRTTEQKKKCRTLTSLRLCGFFKRNKRFTVRARFQIRCRKWLNEKCLQRLERENKVHRNKQK